MLTDRAAVLNTAGSAAIMARWFSFTRGRGGSGSRTQRYPGTICEGM